MKNMYPKVKQTALIGQYPALVNSGGGLVWDEVLEYRVWCHPHNGAIDLENCDDYYYVFATYEEAADFSKATKGTEEPVALILQKECIDETAPNNYIHVPHERMTEWRVDFLHRPQRTVDTIPDFLSPNAPSNRLDILRGID